MSENKEPLNKNNKVPKLRFSLFKYCPYTPYKFFELFKVFNGINKEKESFGYGNPIINYMDVNKNMFLYPNIVTGKVNTNESEIKRFSITTNDILLARTSETIEEIAFASCLIEPIEKCVYSGFLLKAEPIRNDLVFSPYIVLLLRSSKYRLKLMKASTETSRALINSENLLKIDVVIPKINEQKMVYSLFNCLEDKIHTLDKKINALKKYKEGLYQQALKFLIQFGEEKQFSALFKNKNIKNTIGFPQYTVGKYGLKPIEAGNYSISNHKVFNDGDLIVGIGIKEIGISKDIDGSVSPVYDVFKIVHKQYYNSIICTFKNQIWKQRNIVTRKSTRREFEVDKKLLQNMRIKVLDDACFSNYSSSILNMQKMEERLTAMLCDLFDMKKYLLDSMFI